MSIATCLRSCALRLSATVVQMGRNYHAVARIPSASSVPLQRLLEVTRPVLAPPSCGFKVKGRLKRRCKDCYFMISQRRLYVLCKTHPRHKQMAMKAPEKCSWILTHATQSKVRPW